MPRNFISIHGIIVLLVAYSACSTSQQHPRPPAAQRNVQDESKGERPLPVSNSNAEEASRDGTEAAPPKERVPRIVRQLLREKMRRHAKQARDLALASLRLDFGRIGYLVRELLAEGTIARPIAGGDDHVNAQIPPSFFEFQDQLIASAKALEHAAAARDAKAVSSAYGELSQRCVNCHAHFLASKPFNAP